MLERQHQRKIFRPHDEESSMEVTQAGKATSRTSRSTELSPHLG